MLSNFPYDYSRPRYIDIHPSTNPNVRPTVAEVKCVSLESKKTKNKGFKKGLRREDIQMEILQPYFCHVFITPDKISQRAATASGYSTYRLSKGLLCLPYEKLISENSIIFIAQFWSFWCFFHRHTINTPPFDKGDNQSVGQGLNLQYSPQGKAPETVSFNVGDRPDRRIPTKRRLNVFLQIWFVIVGADSVRSPMQRSWRAMHLSSKTEHPKRSLDMLSTSSGSFCWSRVRLSSSDTVVIRLNDCRTRTFTKDVFDGF